MLTKATDSTNRQIAGNRRTTEPSALPIRGALAPPSVSEIPAAV